ncbi:hypothetical protein SCP_0116140 [Sparassis crispa]|uniref:Uncharacterized protein n=1 Tax=Sparassis crispa TaxID=139825 RepID=A0A401G9B2_9APHY|nr:hypothetical protein SCP_0116140 [Sparassis crispa]GBE78723.1 hypothetical protein SCP_0116140 [Sparassis crispa]
MPPSTHASVVYAEQLSRLGYCYPLWDPEPTQFGEVLLGDVGHIFEGQFFRIFNATRGTDDRVNERGVQDGYIPLHFDQSDVHRHENYIPGPLYSTNVRRTDTGGPGETVGKEFTDACRFRCDNSQGAVLLLKESATYEELSIPRRIAYYTKRNIKNWLAFARDSLQLDLALENIISVYGCVKTADWALAAFFDGSGSAELTFRGFGAPAAAAFSVGDTCFSTSPAYNCGPLYATDDNATRRVQVNPVIDDLPDSSSTGEINRKQCIFLRYITLRRHGLFLRHIVADGSSLTGHQDDDYPA